MNINNFDAIQEKKPVTNNQHVVECPNCSYPLVVNLGDTTTKCPCCSSIVNTTQPKDETSKVSEKIAGIKTISAAKAHIDFLFEHYDWEGFSKNASMYSIPEIDALLENMKVSQGDDKETWKMCFDYLYMCLTQKVKNIDKNIEEIVDKYVNGAERNSCHNSFDSLKEGIYILKGKQPKLLEELKNYLDYSVRFGLENKVAKKMDEQLTSITEQLDQINIVDDLEKHPRIAEEINKKMTILEEQYASKQINARELYEKGKAAFDNQNYELAIDAFEQIPDYFDSKSYIDQICACSILGGRYFYMHNDVYFYGPNGLSSDLCHLVNSDNPDTPQFKKFIGCYGNKFYYLNEEIPSIFHYLLLEKEETPKKKKKKQDYPTIFAYGKPSYVSVVPNTPKQVLYITKYDPINDIKEKQAYHNINGIKTKLKPNKKIRYSNWHDLLVLDMKEGTISILLEGINKVVNTIGDTIYYTAPLPVYSKKQVITGYDGTGLYSYNMTTKEIKLLITGDSRIWKIDENQSIIFTRNDHGEDNMTIYTKQGLDNSNEFAVVRNVYRYYTMIKGKIFYLVGNKNVKSLCSINPDATGYVEVMKYMKDIAFSDEDWIYITRGDNKEGYRTLYRIPVDGGNPQKVAFGIHEDDVKDGNRIIKEGYLYYTNYNNVLCRVRLNGTGYQELVVDVYEIATIKYNKVFYICVDGHENNKPIVSLYNMNMDGSNRQKLVHKVKYIGKIDERSLVYVRDETLESKLDLYKDITDPKLNKQITKMYKKFNKKKKYPENVFDVVSRFDCENCYSEVLAYDVKYPNKKDLKLEMKEVLKK